MSEHTSSAERLFVGLVATVGVLSAVYVAAWFIEGAVVAGRSSVGSR